VATKTQRACTLRLSGNTTNRELVPDLLWRTHDAVNQGVMTFANWLLTLRGSISHELVNEPVKTRKGGRPPTDAERRDRRLLLALSWLTVESGDGAPVKYVVGRSGGGWATVETLVSILRSTSRVYDGIPLSRSSAAVRGCRGVARKRNSDDVTRQYRRLGDSATPGARRWR
jgi:hypothetical protein